MSLLPLSSASGLIGQIAAEHKPLSQVQFDSLKTLCTVNPKHGNLRALWTFVESLHRDDPLGGDFACPSKFVSFLLPLVCRSLLSFVTYRPAEQKVMLTALKNGASLTSNEDLSNSLMHLAPSWLEFALSQDDQKFPASTFPLLDLVIQMIDSPVSYMCHHHHAHTRVLCSPIVIVLCRISAAVTTAAVPRQEGCLLQERALFRSLG